MVGYEAEVYSKIEFPLHGQPSVPVAHHNGLLVESSPQRLDAI